MDTSTPGEQCTLRAAIQDANANGTISADLINFNLGGSGTIGADVITLTRGELVIAAATDLDIQGPGVRAFTVSGNDAGRVFRIEDDANVTISGLTISKGNSSPELFGGGILNRGTLTLTDSTVSANIAPSGGGVQNNGGSTLTLVNSTISNNAATGTSASPGEGGGIRDFSGSVTLTNSTISLNTASSGGGIYTNDGFVTLLNSTVRSNVATGTGGGILPEDLGEATLSNTIIAGNSAPTAPDAGSVDSQGNNLIGDTTDSSGWTTSDLQNVNPLLGPLQDNGGPTNTHALLQGSPAIDRGTSTGCPSTDQRGFLRQDGNADGTVACDIGAFEAANTEPTTTNLRPASGSNTRDRTPLIAATVSDEQTNLAKTNVKLFVDGSRKTSFDYNASTDELSYTSGRLSFGRHTVKIVATEGLNRTTRSWRFTVVGR